MVRTRSHLISESQSNILAIGGSMTKAEAVALLLCGFGIWLVLALVG